MVDFTECKTITNMFEKIAEEMCDKYCKYKDTWDADAEGYELFESDICKNCPLNNL